MRRLRKNEKALRAVRPNAGIEAAYRRKLTGLVEEMANSFEYFLKAAYRKNEPVMAQDEVPARDLQNAIDELSKRWQRKFNQLAPELAAYFARRAVRRSDDALRAALRAAGISVRFQMTPAMRDILQATISANVQMIKSIPQQYLTDVQGSVMRSVQAGRDLGSLVKDLTQHYGVTKRRASFISLDQNNKATSAFQRARQIEVGIEYAIWGHSHAGKEPRKTHVANDGKKYRVDTGWHDPDPRVDRLIFPGELPRCRCYSRAIVKGFT